MERIDPLPDHLKLQRFAPGQEMEFEGKRCRILRTTTLATGEPAVVLQAEREQFVVGAARFLAGIKNRAE